MLKTILAILGIMVVCLNPILSGIFLSVAATRWHAEKTMRRPPVPKKEPALKTNQEKSKGFTTYKEVQQRNIDRYMKPGFEKDPVWQAQIKEIHRIMAENSRIEKEKRDNGDYS